MLTLIMLAWIAGTADTSRDAPGKTKLAERLVYSERIVQDLATACAAETQLTARSSSSDWARWALVQDKRIHGLALLRPRGAYRVQALFSAKERAVLDYWLVSHFHDRPLVLLDVLEMACLQEPEVLQMRLGVRGTQALFNHVSLQQAMRLLEKVDTNGTQIADLLLTWAHRHGLDPESYTNPAGRLFVDAAMVLPLPHALLIKTCQWKFWAFPYLTPTQRQGRMYHIGRRLWEAAPPGEPLSLSDEVHVDEMFGPAELATVMDVLRQAATLMPAGFDQCREEIASAVRSLDDVRNSFVRNDATTSRKSYDMKVLVDVVVASGLLRDASDLREIMMHALNVCVREPRLKNYCREALAKKHALPSARTVRRHRLTITVAYCKVLQDELKRLVETDHIVAWGTLDLSPQMGMEWAMQGYIIMGQSQLAIAFRLSMSLCTAGLPADEKSDKRKQLADLLLLRRTVPTGVGSGCSSLRYKVHSATHSHRLTAPDWRTTATVINAMVTWVGDLGEAKLNCFRGNLKAMFNHNIDGCDDIEFDIQGSDNDANNNDQEAAAEPEGPPEDIEFDIEVDEPAPEVPGQAPAPNAVPAPAPEMQPRSDYPMLDDPYDLDFTRSVFIAGPHHVVHNLTEGFEVVLVHWVWYIMRLKHVCRLLSNQWSKRRLLQTCFSNGVALLYNRSIQAFCIKVYEKRWGTAMAAISLLLPVSDGLRQFWNKARFQAGFGHGHENDAPAAGHGHEDEDRGAANIDTADDAITSKRWWGYGLMMDVVAWLILSLISWFDGCPCCYAMPTAADARSHAVRDHIRHRESSKCCMGGKRCPEFAAGSAMRILEFLLNISGNALAVELAGLFRLFV